MDYTLEDRTAKFSEEIILLCKKVPKNVVILPIINQLLKCATSIGANYMEANGASSRRDFRNKISISLKEARETKYWLRLLAKTDESFAEECRNLWKEAHEFTLIFGKINKNSKRNLNIEFLKFI